MAERHDPIPADSLDESYDHDGTHGATTWRPDGVLDEPSHPADSHLTDSHATDSHPVGTVEHDRTEPFGDVAAEGDDRRDGHGYGDEATWDHESLYRAQEGSDGPSTSAPGPATASSEAVRAERERLQNERAARRDARLAALAPAPQPDPAAAGTAPRGATAAAPGSLSPIPSEPVVTERIVTRRSTDRFGPSLGLFLLRLVTAAIMGVHGIQKLLNLPGTTAMLEQTMIPYPSIMAIVIGAAEVAIAIALVFGLMTRIAGLGVALIAGGALAFVRWGNWNPFVTGQSGFTGELELLLAAVGVLLLFTGGGGWAVDRGFRTRRAAERELREA
ncbi:MAG: DoxX family protein [Propionibacteriaceae bacterium]|nr:DoxX family protein [Propionibacteriaceae bacterium]